MKLNKKLIACFCLAMFGFKSYAVTNSPVLMSYWSNTYSADFYPVPGSLSTNGIPQSNLNFRQQVNYLSILAYAALGVHSDGIIHFKNTYRELSATDINFCQQNQAICTDNTGNANGRLGSFSAFTLLQNQNFSLTKIISVGGSNSQAAFNAAIQNPTNFATSAATIINSYKLSGIDLDFELQNTFTAAQATQYASLITLLRQTLGPTKIIALEIAPDSATQDSINSAAWHSIANNANYISLMGYEFHSYLYRPYITGFNSNLYPEISPPKMDRFYLMSDDASVNNLIHLGVPAHKILLGIPAYSHTYGGVLSYNAGLYQDFNPNVTPVFDAFGKGITTYATALSLLHNGFEEHEVYSHGVVSAVYAYNPRTNQFITYENPTSLNAKADYILENHLAGAMVWNIAEDLPVSDSNSVLAILSHRLKIS